MWVLSKSVRTEARCCVQLDDLLEAGLPETVSLLETMENLL